MLPHPNTEVIRAVYQALERRGLEDLAGLLTESAFGRVGGRNALSGTRGLLSLFQTLLDLAPDGLAFDIHDVVANNDHGMAIVRVTCRNGASVYDQYQTHIYELTDGTVAGLFFYWDDPEPADRYFSIS